MLCTSVIRRALVIAIVGLVTLVARASVASAAPPVITTQPQSQTLGVGQALELSVVATSAVAPVYQWLKNGTSINGATTSTFSIPSVGFGDAGNYQVIVENPDGKATSLVAVITVLLSIPDAGTGAGGDAGADAGGDAGTDGGSVRDAGTDSGTVRGGGTGLPAVAEGGGGFGCRRSAASGSGVAWLGTLVGLVALSLHRRRRRSQE
jgi:hypothetical protein